MNPRSAMLGLAGLFLVGLFAVATLNQRLPFGLGAAFLGRSFLGWGETLEYS